MAEFFPTITVTTTNPSPIVNNRPNRKRPAPKKQLNAAGTGYATRADSPTVSSRRAILYL